MSPPQAEKGPVEKGRVKFFDFDDADGKGKKEKS